jgi:hypothetical protein
MTQMNPSFGPPPPPVIELTVEQSFKLRRLQDLLPNADKKDIITVLMALQHQNFVLANSISNLVKQWPTAIQRDPAITSEEP